LSYIPAIVRDFIEAYIESPGTLQILLFLRNEAQREWGPLQLVRTLAMDEPAVEAGLVALKRAGMVFDRIVAEERVYRYQPSGPAFTRAVDELAAAYSTDPGVVISLISSRAANIVRIYRERIQTDEKKGRS